MSWQRNRHAANPKGLRMEELEELLPDPGFGLTSGAKSRILMCL